MDRGQSGVAGARAVMTLVFEVVEERADRFSAEVGEFQMVAGASGPRAGEGEQHPDGVAVGGDGARGWLPFSSVAIVELSFPGNPNCGPSRRQREEVRCPVPLPRRARLPRLEELNRPGNAESPSKQGDSDHDADITSRARTATA